MCARVRTMDLDLRARKIILGYQQARWAFLTRCKPIMKPDLLEKGPQMGNLQDNMHELKNNVTHNLLE